MWVVPTNGTTSWKAEIIVIDGLLPSSECFWGIFDVGCGTSSDDVVVASVALSYDGLSGSIPREIGLLTALTFLNLGFNGLLLEGTIPSEVGLLTSLTWLYLEETNLGGTIPSELGLITNLTELLHLNGNNLEGTIPSENLVTSFECVVYLWGTAWKEKTFPNLVD